MNRISFTVLTAAFLVAAPAFGESCDIHQEVAINGKVLGPTIGVAKKDREFYESLGFTLKKGLFGTTYIDTSDLVDQLSTISCPDSLVEK